MLEFDPLDEYPIHQVALPMRYTGTSDRNFYDRAIYQGVGHEADAYFITGLGVYPNLTPSKRSSPGAFGGNGFGFGGSVTIVSVSRIS